MKEISDRRQCQRYTDFNHIWKDNFNHPPKNPIYQLNANHF